MCSLPFTGFFYNDGGPTPQSRLPKSEADETLAKQVNPDGVTSQRFKDLFSQQLTLLVLSNTITFKKTIKFTESVRYGDVVVKK